MKVFLFLYPIPEYINHEIVCGAHFYDPSNADKEKEFLLKLHEAKTEDEKEEIRRVAFNEAMAEFREKYKALLNSCIDLRYRKNGFNIVYALFTRHMISNVI